MSQRNVTHFACDFCPSTADRERDESVNASAPEGWHSLDVDHDPAVGYRFHVCPAHEALTLKDLVAKIDEQRNRSANPMFYPSEFRRKR